MLSPIPGREEDHVSAAPVLQQLPLDVVVSVLGDHQRPLVVLAPDHDTQATGVVTHCVVVRLGHTTALHCTGLQYTAHLREELVVEDALGELEPVPLLLPQLDLVADGGGDGGAPGHLALRVSVLVQEPVRSEE